MQFSISWNLICTINIKLKLCAKSLAISHIIWVYVFGQTQPFAGKFEDILHGIPRDHYLPNVTKLLICRFWFVFDRKMVVVATPAFKGVRGLKTLTEIWTNRRTLESTVVSKSYFRNFKAWTLPPSPFRNCWCILKIDKHIRYIRPCGLNRFQNFKTWFQISGLLTFYIW